MSVCSPKSNEIFEKDRTCFDRAALVRLVTSWNKSHPMNQIKNIQKSSKRQLWSKLNEKMKTKCKGENKEACWVDKLASNSDPVSKKLRPVAPKEWKKNPYTWLSNFDIEAAMYQYEDEDKYKFKFIGVYPVDFAQKEGWFGKCLYEETCQINFKKLVKKGYKYAGMVINMDKHDEPGSHWTALFIVMDSNLPSYGAYYYDSVSNPPPKEVKEYMELLKQQANLQDSTKEFHLEYNTVRHQYKNSECGIFSMAYIVRWLVLLEKDQNTTFQKVVKIKINDEMIHDLRKKFFREKST